MGFVAAGAASLVSAYNGDPIQIHACVNQATTPRGQVIIYSAPDLLSGEPATITCGTRGTPLDWSPSAPAAASLVGGSASYPASGTEVFMQAPIFGGELRNNLSWANPMPMACTSSNLQVKAVSGLGSNYGYIVVVNTVSVMSCSINGTSTCSDSGSFTVAPSDL
jgi:hypothetical protein